MVDCSYFKKEDYLPEVVPGKDEIWQCLNTTAQKAHGLESYFSEEYQQWFEGRLDYTGACNNCTYREPREGKVTIDAGSTRAVLPQELAWSLPPERMAEFLITLRSEGIAQSRTLPPDNKQLHP